jgi:MtN3 and saliva related transmembrane protein
MAPACSEKQTISPQDQLKSPTAEPILRERVSLENQIKGHKVEFSPRLATTTGSIAALFTTVACVPQLKKCWATGKADDLSFKMFALLASGIALRVAYGVLQNDLVIIVANSISLLLLCFILYFKIAGSGR